MLKINLGCGWRDFGEGWVHIDGGDYDHIESKNICDLPYEDGSVDLIYASHVIEYFDREEVQVLLINWQSKLKKGGILRLAVPDFSSMSRLYQDGAFNLDSFLGPLYGKMKMQENLIYHKTTYDFISLKNILNEIGFKDIQLWDYNNVDHGHIDDYSKSYIPHMDKNGTLMSLNIQAIK